jgi:hypothetical protein
LREPGKLGHRRNLPPANSLRLAALRQKSHCVGQYMLRQVAGTQANSIMRQDLMRRFFTARLAASVRLGVFLSMAESAGDAMTAMLLANHPGAEQPNFIGFAGAFLAGRTADMDNDTGNAQSSSTARRWSSTRKTST